LVDWVINWLLEPGVELDGVLKICECHFVSNAALGSKNFCRISVGLHSRGIFSFESARDKGNMKSIPEENLLVRTDSIGLKKSARSSYYERKPEAGVTR
jgi:hypothetical protein